MDAQILKEISGDLLEIDVIAQQCNCLTVRSHGLAKTISEQMDIDIYKVRTPVKIEKNLSVCNDRGIPGTCQLVKNESKYPPKYVACLLAQFAPGKPQFYYRNITAYHGYRDDSYDRHQWFRNSLDELAENMKRKKLTTIAFPKYIGSNLAGGNWEEYYLFIKSFALKYGFMTYIVELDQLNKYNSPQYQLINRPT